MSQKLYDSIVTTKWNITMLGGFSVSKGSHFTDRFQTQKTAILLAFLSTPPFKQHSREVLATMLWPDADSDTGRNRLSQAVGWLRKQFDSGSSEEEKLLIADRVYVGIKPECVSVDVHNFEQSCIAALKEQIPQVQRELLKNAVTIYTGSFLPGYFEDWIINKRSDLDTNAVRVLRRLCDSYKADQNWDEALIAIRQALQIDPYDELLNFEHIRLLILMGQQSKAVRLYREYQRYTFREFGSEPGLTFDELLSESLQPALQLAVHRSAVSAPIIPSLPSNLTRFFGRESEITTLENMVASHRSRLITITGLGGAGKTRLVTESAATIGSHFPGGVGFISLADLKDPQHVASAISEVLMLPRSEMFLPIEQLVNSFPSLPFLLIFDNAEHIIPVIRSVVSVILKLIHNVTVICTSRQSLNIAGEQEISLQALSTPVNIHGDHLADKSVSLESILESDSVRLFIDRARLVRSDFDITEENASTISQICTKLEGLPLAIELCAAWAQSLTPAQMLLQLTNRFHLLVSRRSDIPARHRTMQAALEYSYLLLPMPLQQFFIGLSVFRGGWRLEGATILLASPNDTHSHFEVVGQLTELIERSMVIAEAALDGEMRYRMLETLREFAEQQVTMAMDSNLRQKHLEYYVKFAERAVAHITGEDQAVWFRKIEMEHENFRSALSFSLERSKTSTNHLELGLRLCIYLVSFWEMRGYALEGQVWLEKFISVLEDLSEDELPLAIQARAYYSHSILTRSKGDFGLSETSINRSLQLWRSQKVGEGLAAALQVAATLAYSRLDFAQARSFLEEAKQISLDIGNDYQLASAFLNLGNIALELQEWKEARELYTLSLNLRRQQGNIKLVGDALNNLGLVARYLNELEQARALFEEALPIGRKLSDRSGTAITLLNLGTVELLSKQFQPALNYLQEAVTTAKEVGNRRALAWSIKELGHWACAQSDFMTAAQLISFSETLRADLGMSFLPADPGQIDTDVNIIEQALGSAAFKNYWQKGSRFTLEQVANIALDLQFHS